jgi:putative oxidoreductase
MWKKLISTENDIATAVLRIMLGVVFFPHGAQKVLGWFGGYGFAGTYDAFTNKMGIPGLFALLAFAAEFLGSIGLVFGFMTRLAAFGIFCVMAVAVKMLHWQHGFFMNWFGQQKGEGFEYHLLVMAIAAALMIRGAGAYSVDGVLADKK